MTQPADTSAAVGDANNPVDAPAPAKNPLEDFADALGLEEAEPEEEEQPEGEEEAEPEPEEEPEPEAPAIEPPTSWKADAKEAFKQLPPELQKVVTDREAERERFVQSKAQEAAQTRQSVEAEARQAIAQLSQQTAAELQQYAALIQPQRPDPSNYPDWQTYSTAQAQYETALAQRDNAQQQAAQYEAHAKAQEHAIEAEYKKAEVATLKAQFPEWFDPTAGANHQQELTAIAREMGYSDEHVSGARAVDILAMRRAAEWKVKADKFDALNSAKMANVRAAKDLPKVTKPGVARGAPSPQAKQEAAWQRVTTATSKEAREGAFADFLGL